MFLPSDLSFFKFLIVNSKSASLAAISLVSATLIKKDFNKWFKKYKKITSIIFLVSLLRLYK